MTLQQLIERLTREPNKTLKLGFHNPHSYRGDYYCVAFQPRPGATVKEMLTASMDALGGTFAGWKGGEYKMHKGTYVYLADKGNLGEELGPRLLEYILADAQEADDDAS